MIILGTADVPSANGNRGGQEERSLLMWIIYFVFPKIVDAIFNLIRFQDITRLSTLQVTSMFLSTVACYVNL